VKKGIVLVVVMGVVMIMCALAIVAVSLALQETHQAEHKIARIKAFFAAQAGMIDGLDQLRLGTQPIPTIGSPTTYSLGESVNGCTPFIMIVARGDNYVYSADETYWCDAGILSDSCVFARVGY